MPLCFVCVCACVLQSLAAGLLGRGFALWTPHMSQANVVLLIRRLLEIVCTGENATTRSEANSALLKVRRSATVTLACARSTAVSVVTARPSSMCVVVADWACSHTSAGDVPAERAQPCVRDAERPESRAERAVADVLQEPHGYATECVRRLCDALRYAATSSC